MGGQDWGYHLEPLGAESGLELLEGDWENWVGELGVLENQDRENGGRTGRTGRSRKSRTVCIWGTLTGESALELEERDWGRGTGRAGCSEKPGLGVHSEEGLGELENHEWETGIGAGEDWE